MDWKEPEKCVKEKKMDRKVEKKHRELSHFWCKNGLFQKSTRQTHILQFSPIFVDTQVQVGKKRSFHKEI